MSSPRSPQPEDSSPPLPPSVPVPPLSETNNRFPIVGIGASAGGLEAFTQLLTYLPVDRGMAYVLVQHLASNQPSMLGEILQRTTQMPVVEVQDGMAVEPNHVYVIPPNAVMTIAQGTLHLTRRKKTEKINKTVDLFFYSLAEDWADKAIAVVLSGADSDGAQGVEAIKEAGGITFAQSVDSAQVSGMPSSAIATGQIDFVLTPQEIAAELANLSQHPYVTTSAPIIVRDDGIDQVNALTTIFMLLQTHFGVDFTHYKRTTIHRRIFRRMALQHLEQLSIYVHYLQENPEELQALYREILINVTSFFRDPAAFEILKRDVFLVLLRAATAETPIRIWVAGCSTGEEAYSIAICLLEFLARQPRQPQIQIFATDVSEQMIEKARAGVYLPYQVAEISPERLQRFFVPVEGGYQISKAVRERCVFARQNLISDPPFCRMDLISCRNVLIYLGSLLQKKVLPMFHYGLKHTGFLMLGSSETVGEYSNLFNLVDSKYKIYSKHPTSRLLPMELENLTYPVEPALPLPSHDAQLSQVNLSGIADQIVLNHYAPVGVVVNNQLDIVQFRGQTGAYLEPSPGQASLNLLSMVREELRLDLRTAIHQAKQEGQAVRKEGIPLRNNNQTQRIQVDVVPLNLGASSSDYFLILFREMLILPPSSKVDASSTKELKGKRQRQEQAEISRLEEELKNTKAHLQSIIEEQHATNQDLRAANEEILSSNEELQSTNEELQTAKEEIQATNEELGTINDELYRRNVETMEVSNDFQNLLSSISIPILMLESDLRIRRFTPTAAALFNLIPTDVGRPFSNINHKLSITNLEATILEVINSLNLHSEEVQDQDGHWYDLRIRPYRTLDNRIDGAVVVLVQIDALKRSAEQVREARDYAEAIVETVRDSLLVLNSTFKVVMANRRFYETFQVSPRETLESLIFDLGNGQWNIPQLRSLLEDLLPHNTQIENFEVNHTFEHIGPKTMRLNARRMPLRNDEQLILLAIENVINPSNE